MKFTRKQVLTAIRYENLESQHFYFDNRINGGECTVCAVGGVLRRAGVPTGKITDRAWQLIGGTNMAVSSEQYLKDALAGKNYLQALSIKFESLSEKYVRGGKGGFRRKYKTGGKAIRKALAVFVKDEFPKEFKSIGR